MSALINESHRPVADADDAERRIAPRVKVLKRAQVLFNNNFSTFDCVVRNISATGALLTLDESAHLPKEFGVRIGEDKTIRPARLVYRRGSLTGIRFLDYVDDTEEAEFPTKDHSHADEPSSPAETILKVASKPLPLALHRNFRWF